MLEQVKQKAVADIVTFGMSFRCSALFMIRKKYPKLDLSNANLTKIEWHDVPNLANGSMQSKG